jgi:Raf kinase inhibitor-like YbhB/YbcL family protein
MVFVLAAAAWLVLTACGGDDDSSGPTTSISSGPSAGGFEMRSSAFHDGGAIPARYTCDGAQVSPPLSWAHAPSNTTQFALIVDDPDAPHGTFVHWVLWGIAGDSASIEAGDVPPGASQGKNGAGPEKYAGPCPPSGTHRYRFQLFALSRPPAVDAGADAATLRAAIADRTLASTTLVGTYHRS